jgi:hypothetical protein
MNTFVAIILVGMFTTTAIAERPKAEFELATEKIGINIKKLAAQAQKGNYNAIRVLLVLGFDGGAAEGFSVWQPQILRTVPDEKLAMELGSLPKVEQRAVVKAMQSGLSEYQLRSLKKGFPKTFALMQ